MASANRSIRRTGGTGGGGPPPERSFERAPPGDTPVTGPVRQVNLPSAPGVYLMKDAAGTIIYIGKAKDLKKRVSTYFVKGRDDRYQIAFLMKRVATIDTMVCANEKEALLLENSLIKKERPRYNIFLKDDKSYASIKISVKHPFPAVTVTRKIKKDGSLYFGPYSSATALRETTDFLHRYYRLRTCTDSDFLNRSRPCIEYQIHRCSAPCVGYVNREQYASQVKATRSFLEGKNANLLQEIREKIEGASKKEEFEEAGRLRDLLKQMEVTLEKQNVVRHLGCDRDIISFSRKGEKVTVAFLFVRLGSLVDSKYFHFSSFEEDSSLLENVVSQYYAREGIFIPDEILVALNLEGASLLAEILSEKKGKKVLVATPHKGEKHRLLELATRNAQVWLEKAAGKEIDLHNAMEGLKARLGLLTLPSRMECYDISNISGKFATGSRVVFMDGLPDKNAYRHYRIRRGDTPDDYAMLKEILGRRFAHISLLPRWEEDRERVVLGVPDLMVIDGGKGQLNMALTVLKEMGFESIPVIGFAKGVGAGARGKGIWKGKKEEEIYLPNRKNPLKLKMGSAELMLLQRLRDEAHRFAVSYHRKLRDRVSSAKMRKFF